MSIEKVTVSVEGRKLRAKAHVAIKSKEVEGEEGIVAYLTKVEAQDGDTGEEVPVTLEIRVAVLAAINKSCREALARAGFGSELFVAVVDNPNDLSGFVPCAPYRKIGGGKETA